MGNSKDSEVQLSRKARRKQERKARKQKRAPKVTQAPPPSPAPTPRQKTDKRSAHRASDAQPAVPNAKRQKKYTKDDPYAGIDPILAAQMRRDDEEIAELEAKLGLSNAKNKTRLNREYANLEGYGDDFGEFLDGLDDMVRRVTRGTKEDDEYYKKKTGDAGSINDENDESSLESPYHSGDEDGQDIIEKMNDMDEDSMEEEIVPMKGPEYGDAESDDKHPDSDGESDSDSEAAEPADNEKHEQDKQVESTNKEKEEAQKYGSADDKSEESDEFDSEHEDSDDAGPADQDTYHPIKGEDIYGKVKSDTTELSGGKYIPPHLRKKQVDEGRDRRESLRMVERLLNNSLNRLSEDTLLSVSQAVAKLYDSHSKSDLNESIWKISRNTCVERNFLMTGLTPVYVAALVGVHHLRSNAQLAEHLIELVSTELYKELGQQSQDFRADTDQDPETISKRACNLALVLCYLYNYGVVHCNLLYDFIRKLIKTFQEVDVEVLLIFLSHSGRSLRADDPLALKDIVLEVQRRAAQETSSSSRVDYMLSAMMDLKNNKRRPQDVSFAEKTSKLRKSIGHIKSKVATTNGKANDNSLRLTLKDVLEAETRGRWWRVGASWAGNQYKYQESDTEEDQGSDKGAKAKTESPLFEADEKLLKLAAKYRMNTDIRRSIFCIIMGAADCDDAFEKIVRAGVLKNKNERDAVRVLIECCGNEKNYNKFYEHLANRICEFQSRCRFTFQLAFWDVFKQLENMKLRKAANLAKLLFSLVVQHHVLKLNVFKAIDMTTPEDLPETATIFLTIFFSNVMEYFPDEAAVAAFFESAIHQNRSTDADVDVDEMGHADEADALRASFTLFFVQVLKLSPKYKKGSKFRVNLKAAIKTCDTDNFF